MNRIERFRRTQAERSQYRKTLAELRRLSPGQLEDIGLVGLSLERVARAATAA